MSIFIQKKWYKEGHLTFYLEIFLALKNLTFGHHKSVLINIRQAKILIFSLKKLTSVLKKKINVSKNSKISKFTK